MNAIRNVLIIIFAALAAVTPHAVLPVAAAAIIAAVSCGVSLIVHRLLDTGAGIVPRGAAS